LLCAYPLSAAVQGFFVVLTSGSPTYGVPTNKVLVLQVVSTPGASCNGGNNLALTPPNGIGTANIYVPTAMYYLSNSLKLPAGTTLSNNCASMPLGIFGLLVDPTDLYAGIGYSSTIENVAVNQGVMSGELALSTPRPASVQMQSSTNLADWQTDTNVVTQPTADKTRVVFSTSVDPVQNRYLRAAVRPR
jgi:hypothetical protein